MRKTTFSLCFLISFLAISLLLSVKSVAQQSVSVAYNYGEIVPHSDAIKPLIINPVKGFTINYYLSNKKGEEWRNFFNQTMDLATISNRTEIPKFLVIHIL